MLDNLAVRQARRDQHAQLTEGTVGGRRNRMGAGVERWRMPTGCRAEPGEKLQEGEKDGVGDGWGTIGRSGGGERQRLDFLFDLLIFFFV